MDPKLIPAGWKGVLYVESLEYVRGGKTLWTKGPFFNLLHLKGEEFILGVVFGNTTRPSKYYLGLDARPTVALDDTLADIVGEPGGNGYSRQQVNSFTIDPVQNAYKALSSVVAFSAAGASWGPVENLFLATTSDNNGVLLSTITMDTAFSVAAGDSVLMRMGLLLRNP